MLGQHARAANHGALVLFSTPTNTLIIQMDFGFVVAYALSPIDLVPDFIPVLGYLDDVIILPLGILLAIRLMPAQVLKECQVKAIKWEESREKRPVSRFAAVVIVLVWLIAAVGVWWAYVL